MQVFVTCPDLGFPAVSVTVGADSVVSDVLTAAVGEWDVDLEEVELSFAGDALCDSDRLADHGVGANSELEIWEKLVRIFGKRWFVDDRKREKLLLWIRDHVTEDLCLDTPWMVASLLTRGCFLQMPNGFPSAIQIAIARSSHRLLLLEITSCVIVQKSLLLTFQVLVVSPVLEMVFCLVVQKSLGITTPASSRRSRTTSIGVDKTVSNTRDANTINTNHHIQSIHTLDVSYRRKKETNWPMP